MNARTTRQTAGAPGEGRAQTLAAALEIIDHDGIEGLSMRKLGRSLGRDPMSLYRHGPTKADLLDGVAESILSELPVDISDDGWAG